MKLRMKLYFIVIIYAMFFSVQSIAADGPLFSMEPTANPQGQPWRVGYYEGGEYIDYQQTLFETIRHLMKLGWIKASEIPVPEGEKTDGLWRWLATEAKSDYIEFVADAYYSAEWDGNKRTPLADAIINRLKQRHDIDLMIAMGTWAGKDLANNRHRTPTIVLSSSDPVAAGIIPSVADSGFEHVHATVDPYLFERQIRIFHEIIGFKRLGVAYEDSVNGRSYAALDVTEKLSQKRNFEVVHCHTQSDISDILKAEKSVIECFEKLAGQVDAIYVTQQGGVNSQSISTLVQIANKHDIPTFSQSGSDEVRQGVLLSLSHAGFRFLGEFHAKTIAQIFNGAKPGHLEQLFEEPPKIAINLETAEDIGFSPSLQLLGAADEIFSSVIVSK